MADSHLLCTPDDVKMYIKVGTNFGNYDSVIAAMIRIASDQIVKFVGRDLTYGVRTQYIGTPQTRDGTPATLKLTGDNVDYSKPIAVFFDGTGRFGANAAALTLDYDYAIDQNTNSIILLSEFGYSPRGIKVTYTAGYEEEVGNSELLQVPANLRDATAMQAGFLYTRVQSGSLGKISEEKENTSRVVWAKAAVYGLLPEVRAMIGGAGRASYVGRS